jgi:oligoribonuclease NrnB/cAMP/cGMP phosphodiesterase (DHH superfamily)
VLAWEFLQAISTRKEKMPEMLKHVQDRDLWQFKLPGTREISEALFSEVYDFNVWDRLLNSKKRDIDKMITMGGLVVKKHFKDVEEILTSAKRPMLIGGHMVPVASMSYMMASDAGNIMSKDAVFAGTYYDTEKSRNFSLRSNKENPNWMDVSLIAMQYGGGGHPHASGFSVPRAHELAMA